LDALVNVAAVYRRNRELTKSNLELMFATNHLAPFVLTNELLGLLKASAPSRVVTVSAPSSTKVNFDDLQGEQKFASLNAFGASKMMNLQFTYALARRLEGSHVSAMAMHPGLVKSDLTNEMPGFLKFLFGIMSSKPDKAAAMLTRLALDPKFEKSNGKFYKFNGKEMKSSAYSHEQEPQEKLWALSEKMMRCF
jgi:NAD(P)-dependent dehydrogenase (short-subunit alcohol dehydrogenase family)